MRKAHLNFLIEILTMLALIGLLATGALLEWRLPPGREGGHGLTWLGYTRHGWGDVHFWLGVAFIVLLVAHIWMHWRWIRGMVRGRDARRARLRMAGLAAAIVVLLALLAVPWLVPVEGQRGAGEAHEELGYESPEEDRAGEGRGDGPVERRQRRRRGG